MRRPGSYGPGRRDQGRNRFWIDTRITDALVVFCNVAEPPLAVRHVAEDALLMRGGSGLTPTSVRLMHRVLYALALPPAVVAIFVVVGPGEANVLGALAVAVMLALPLLTVWATR